MPNPKDPTKSKRRSIFRFPSLFNKHSSVRSSAATSLTVTGTSLTTVGHLNASTNSPSLETNTTSPSPSILNTIQSLDASLAAAAIAGDASITTAAAINALNDLRSTIDSAETETDTSHLDSIKINHFRLIAEKYTNSRWPSKSHWINPHVFMGYNTLTGEMHPDYPPPVPGQNLSNEKALPKLMRLAVSAAHHVRVRPDEAREFDVRLGEEGEGQERYKPAELRLPRTRAGLFKPTDIKFVIEQTEDGNGGAEEEGVGGTVVVAIRGSRTWMDWLVNFNCDLADAEKSTGEPNSKCHSGFLTIKRLMAYRLVEELKRLLNFPASRPPAHRKPRLLLTGHSAGGAIAALFWYNFIAYSPQTMQDYHDTIWAQFHSITCITFGAPPILFPALWQTVKSTPFDPTNFCIGFVNEGDPVPRADFAYLKALLHIYHEGHHDFKTSGNSSTSHSTSDSPRPTAGNLMSLPRMSLYPAGTLIGLHADNTNPSVGLQIRGINLTNTLLEKTLACNPTAHSMDTYAQTVLGYLDQDLPSLSSATFTTITETRIPFPGTEDREDLDDEWKEWKEVGDLDEREIWEVRSLEHLAGGLGRGGEEGAGGSRMKGMFRQRKIFGVEALERRMREIAEMMHEKEEEWRRV